MGIDALGRLRRQGGRFTAASASISVILLAGPLVSRRQVTPGEVEAWGLEPLLNRFGNGVQQAAEPTGLMLQGW
jgi:hypothetical protein